MRYKYTRPTIQIKNWIISQDDIGRLVDFFKKRFSIDNVEIVLETVAGDNRQYATYDEFLGDIVQIIKNHEKVSRIHISHRSSIGNLVTPDFKQVWIDIVLDPYTQASFCIVCGDGNGTYKDWVVGTYEEMKKLADLFELKDEKLVATFRKHYPAIVLDYSGSIRARIKSIVHSEASKIAAEKDNKVNRSLWERFLNNPWTIAVGATIAGGLVLAWIL